MSETTDGKNSLLKGKWTILWSLSVNKWLNLQPMNSKKCFSVNSYEKSYSLNCSYEFWKSNKDEQQSSNFHICSTSDIFHECVILVTKFCKNIDYSNVEIPLLSSNEGALCFLASLDSKNTAYI